MRMLFVVPLLGFMSFSLAAFVPQSVDTSKRGLVYGHLESSAPLEQVEVTLIGSLKRVGARVLPNGDFYFADLEPGQYVLTRFHAGGGWHELTSGHGIRTLTVDVRASTISYAGSWKATPRGVVVSERPAPDVLLKRLRYALRGTGWEQRIP